MTKKRLKMGDSREVRRTINRINNMLLNGEIDAKTANALIYGCNAALGAIRVDDQQAKLDELEKLIKEFEQNPTCIGRSNSCLWLGIGTPHPLRV